MGRLIKNIFKGATTIFSITPAPKLRPASKKHYKPYKSAVSATKSDWMKIGGDFNKAIQRAAHGER